MNPGERVKWTHNEPGAEPEEMRGVILYVIPHYQVRWDDGTVEECEDGDIELESS